MFAIALTSLSAAQVGAWGVLIVTVLGAIGLFIWRCVVAVKEYRAQRQCERDIYMGRLKEQDERDDADIAWLKDKVEDLEGKIVLLTTALMEAREDNAALRAEVRHLLEKLNE